MTDAELIAFAKDTEYDDSVAYRLATALEQSLAREKKMRNELEWIAGINQDAILDAPEVWGVVLETARAALAACKEV